MNEIDNVSTDMNVSEFDAEGSSLSNVASEPLLPAEHREIDHNAADNVSWKKLTALLCVSAFFLNVKPSEPFLTPFFLDVKGITEEQVGC